MQEKLENIFYTETGETKMLIVNFWIQIVCTFIRLTMEVIKIVT
jgi:hypothetical protein